MRLTATRVSVSHYKRFKLRLQSRLLLREVILWGLLTTPAYWKRQRERVRQEGGGEVKVDAPSSPGKIPPISLYSKNGCDISLSEKRPAAMALYSRNVCCVPLCIRETDTGRGEPKMKTGTVRGESYPLWPNPTSKYANVHIHLYPPPLICTYVR